MTEIGLQLQFIVLPIALVAVVLVTGLLIFLDERFGEGWPWGAAPFYAAFGGVIVGLLLVFYVFALVPFQSKYQVLYSATGEVASVDATFNVDGGDITNNYIVTLAGDPILYRLSDPRAALLDGPVTLTCTAEWVYAGADRINCVIAN